jgi:hypothetical protein
MATEIPTQLEFEHILSHTFPGFLLAFTFFMLIDIWSPYYLTQLVFTDISGLIAFAGFVLLIGTIFGVVIDNLHHYLIEDGILRYLSSVKIWDEGIKKQIEKHIYGKDFSNTLDKNLTYQFFFNYFGNNAIQLNNYIRNAKYCYSEFFSNIFISLLAFTLVSPFYLFLELQIVWEKCIIISIISFIASSFCLYSSYDTYVDYYQALYSMIKGLDYPCKSTPCAEGSETASIGQKEAD